MTRLLLALALLAAPAAAQERALQVGSDVYHAGGAVVLDETAEGDVFFAGEAVRIEAPVAGSAHLAGRRVTAEAPVQGSLYAAGMDVAVSAPVAGSASLAGYEVIVGAEIGGSLRAMGRRVRVEARVGGGVLLAGQEVTLDAPVFGDAAIAADELVFGESARIDGRLVLYGEPEDATAVPARVVPLERIELREVGRSYREEVEARRAPVASAAGGYLAGVAIVALCALLAASIAPYGIEGLRDSVALRPFGTLGLGFLALSALLGSAVMLALTIVGLLLVPAVLIAVLLAGFAGYVVAVYMLGAGISEWWRRREPASLGQRALAALVGSALAALIFLLPFLGWFFMLGAILIGTGALARAAFGRRILA